MGTRTHKHTGKQYKASLINKPHTNPLFGECVRKSLCILFSHIHQKEECAIRNIRKKKCQQKKIKSSLKFVLSSPKVFYRRIQRVGNQIKLFGGEAAET